MFIPIEEAIRRFRQGEVLILVDDEDRENEGDFAIAAEHVTPEVVNFMITHGRGLVCVPITEARSRALDLPQMCPDRESLHETRFTVSVDARDGITTGISSHDRAKTIRLLVDDEATPEQLVRPGHVFPLIARDGGVLRRPGHTEATVDLARLAGLKPAAVLCEVLCEDGSMARGAQLEAIAEKHGIALVRIVDLIEHRKSAEGPLEQVMN